MPQLATTCWPTVMPVPAQPPVSMEDLMSMLLISNDSMSLGTVSLQVRQRHLSQPGCHITGLLCAQLPLEALHMHEAGF